MCLLRFTIRNILRFSTPTWSGSPHKDLRFFVRARVGAIPRLDSPEEVALINCNGGGMDDGIWYSQHLACRTARRILPVRRKIGGCSPHAATTSKRSSPKTIICSAGPRLPLNRWSTVNA